MHDSLPSGMTSFNADLLEKSQQRAAWDKFGMPTLADSAATSSTDPQSVETTHLDPRSAELDLVETRGFPLWHCATPHIDSLSTWSRCEEGSSQLISGDAGIMIQSEVRLCDTPHTRTQVPCACRLACSRHIHVPTRYLAHAQGQARHGQRALAHILALVRVPPFSPT